MKTLNKTTNAAATKRWEAHCTEALCRLAGIRILEHGQRQACNAALEAQLASHTSAEGIGAFLSHAFTNPPIKQEPGRTRRAHGATPMGLFRRNHLAHIVQAHAGCLISKQSILLSLGTELESAILADLTPNKVRQIVCQTLDGYVPQPPRKRKPRKLALAPTGAGKSAPEAHTIAAPKTADPSTPATKTVDSPV